MSAAASYYFIGVAWLGCLYAMGALRAEGDDSPIAVTLSLALSAAIWPLLLWRCFVALRSDDDEVDFSP